MPRTTPISDALHDRLFEAFFTETLRAETAARDNADRAFAVASAVAGALVAAGVAIDIRARAWWVQAAGLVALALWLIAAYFFMTTVSHSTYSTVPAVGVENAQWGNQTVEDALLARSTIYAKLSTARNWSAAAGVVTIAALALAITDHHEDTKQATFTLHRDGAAGVRLLCPGTSGLSGTVALSSLDSEFVTIKLPRGSCGGKSQTLRIDRSDVIGLLTK